MATLVGATWGALEVHVASLRGLAAGGEVNCERPRNRCRSSASLFRKASRQRLQQNCCMYHRCRIRPNFPSQWAHPLFAPRPPAVAEITAVGGAVFKIQLILIDIGVMTARKHAIMKTPPEWTLLYPKQSNRRFLLFDLPHSGPLCALIAAAQKGSNNLMQRCGARALYLADDRQHVGSVAISHRHMTRFGEHGAA
jgi:hypothetical protein